MERNMKKEISAQVLRDMIIELERRLGVLDDQISDCCGLSMAQCHAVVELGRKQSASLNTLAQSLNLENSTVSRTVNNLVNSSLAERKEDDNDRRYVAITLTDDGKKVFDTIENGMDDFFNKIMSRIPQEKHEQVLDSLQVLLDAIGSARCCR
jgi:DNA-binding MarR family transcriptional regulator